MTEGQATADRPEDLVTDVAVSLLESPQEANAEAVRSCLHLLGEPGVSSSVIDQVLVLLLAALYTRPDLVSGREIASAVAGLFSAPQRPDTNLRLAGEVLGHLASSSHPHVAIDSLLALLEHPQLQPAAYETLTRVLEAAVTWAIDGVDLARIVQLAGQPHLAGYRKMLLEGVIEPVLFASPSRITRRDLERLIEIYRDGSLLTTCLMYLAGYCAVGAEVRAVARAARAALPIAETVRARLATGPRRALVVQNIADRQGDEIIRVVPLVQALLDLNPELQVQLVTARPYLYAHPRITLTPIADAPAVDALLQDPTDVLIEFFEPNVRSVNHDLSLRWRIQQYLERHTPFLHIGSHKGYNHFVYGRVDVAGDSDTWDLALDRQRVPNVYETTFRLIANLGLPLRLGEQPPISGPVLAGIPSAEAERVWRELTKGNDEGRPVALLNPFGGGERLKGYARESFKDLADRIRDMIDEGFFVVLLPNGTLWGSREQARDVVSRLSAEEQRMVGIGPDPADRSGPVTYNSPHPITVPAPSYAMHLVTHFVRFSDLVVAVEGWMIHVAYCLGKPYQILMLPYSHPAGWHPYGHTARQIAVPTANPDPAETPLDAPPLPTQPRKFVLLALLRPLGSQTHPRILPILRWAARSPDRDVRLAAATGLRRHPDGVVAADLEALLDDPYNAVRAQAAMGLLERAEGERENLGSRREELQAYRLIGPESPGWSEVIRLGEAARPALRRAIQDEDGVVRREAEGALAIVERQATERRRTERQSAESKRPRALSSWPLRRRKQYGPGRPRVLILTPVKDAADCIDGYCDRLSRLTYPHSCLSLGFLESDSRDGTYERLQERLPALRRRFRRVGLWKRDFGYRVPPGIHRGAEPIQIERRTVLAKSRNHLLFHALDDEEWVLWLDVDVVEYPPDLVECLLATGKTIVQPHCVLEYGGPTFDHNGWRDHGRYHLDDLRDEGELVPLDAVGGTVLLVRADLHRDGLVFPSFLYGRGSPRARADRGELETEGLGIMAHDMGHQCWGMPHLEVIHRRH